MKANRMSPSAVCFKPLKEALDQLVICDDQVALIVELELIGFQVQFIPVYRPVVPESGDVVTHHYGSDRPS